MGRKTYRRGSLPPCPDTEAYVLIRTAEGLYYWRRKRGTVKPAMLNEKMQQYSDLNRVSSPAASRILKRLHSFMKGFKKGRSHLKLTVLLLKTLREKKVIDFSKLHGFEFNPNYPLDHLLINHYTVKEKDGHLTVTIEQEEEGVKPQNNLATDYYYELIIVWGDATNDGELQLRHTSSALYSFTNTNPPVCELELPLPTGQQPWMALLKAGCLEGNELAIHPKHYGMRVVGTSS